MVEIKERSRGGTTLEDTLQEVANSFLESYSEGVVTRFSEKYREETTRAHELFIEDIARKHIVSGNFLEARQLLNGGFTRVAKEVRAEADSSLAERIGIEIGKQLIREGDYSGARQILNGTYNSTMKEIRKEMEGRYNVTGDRDYLSRARGISIELGDNGRLDHHQLMRRRKEEAQQTPDQSSTNPLTRRGSNYMDDAMRGGLSAAGYQGR